MLNIKLGSCVLLSIMTLGGGGQFVNMVSEWQSMNYLFSDHSIVIHIKHAFLCYRYDELPVIPMLPIHNVPTRGVLFGASDYPPRPATSLQVPTTTRMLTAAVSYPQIPAKSNCLL